MFTAHKRKKYKIKVRVKIQKHRIQKTLIFIAIMTGAVGLFYYGSFFFVSVSSRIDKKFLTWKVRSIEVLIDNEAVKNGILNDFKNKIGKEWNKKTSRELAAQIRTKYQCIKDLKIRGNFWTKTLILKSSLHKPVARVKLMDGQKAYLTETGEMIDEPCGEIEEDAVEVNLSVITRKGDSPHSGTVPFLNHLVRFVKEINSNRDAFAISPESINCNAADCTVKLSNNFEIKWGEFELTQSKILRLNYILNDIRKGDSSQRNSPQLKGDTPAFRREVPVSNKPFKIDLRYFKNGKIFVSEIK